MEYIKDKLKVGDKVITNGKILVITSKISDVKFTWEDFQTPPAIGTLEVTETQIEDETFFILTG